MARVPPRGRIVVLVATVLLLGGPAAAQSPPDALDLATYQQRIDAALDAARAGMEDPTGARLEQVRDGFIRPIVVELGEGTIEIPADPVIADLDGATTVTFRTAVDRLERLQSTAAAAGRAPELPAAQLQTTLDQVYDGLSTSPTVQERLWRFAQDLLLRIAEWLGSASGGVGTAVAVVLGLLGLAGVWALARRLFVVADEHAPPEHEITRTPEDWRGLADAALERGDLEAAVRAQYQLLLLELTRRGAIRDAPSLTPAEARAAVAADRTLLDPVATATGVFERMAYRGDPPARDEVERMRDAVREAAA